MLEIEGRLDLIYSENYQVSLEDPEVKSYFIKVPLREKGYNSEIVKHFDPNNVAEYMGRSKERYMAIYSTLEDALSAEPQSQTQWYLPNYDRSQKSSTPLFVIYEVLGKAQDVYDWATNNESDKIKENLQRAYHYENTKSFTDKEASNHDWSGHQLETWYPRYNDEDVKAILQQIDRLKQNSKSLLGIKNKFKAELIRDALNDAIERKVADVRTDKAVQDALGYHRIFNFFGKPANALKSIKGIQTEVKTSSPSETPEKALAI